MKKSTPAPASQHAAPIKIEDLRALFLRPIPDPRDDAPILLVPNPVADLLIMPQSLRNEIVPPALAQLAGGALAKLGRRELLDPALALPLRGLPWDPGSFHPKWKRLAHDCLSFAQGKNPRPERLFVGVAGVALASLVRADFQAKDGLRWRASGAEWETLRALLDPPGLPDANLPAELRPLAREIARGILKPHRDGDKILTELYGILDAAERERPEDVDPAPETEPATRRQKRKRTTKAREEREAALLGVFTAQVPEALTWPEARLADEAGLSPSDLRRILEDPHDKTLGGYATERRNQRVVRDGRGRFSKRDKATVAALRGSSRRED